MKKLISLMAIVALSIASFGAKAASGSVTFKFKTPSAVTKVSVSSGSVTPATGVAEDGVYVFNYNNTYSSNIIFTLDKTYTVEDVTVTNESTEEPVEQATSTWRINNGTALQIYSGSSFPDGSTFIISTGDDDGGDEGDDDPKSETAITMKFTIPDAIEKIENDWSGAAKTYTLEDGQLVYDIADGNVPTITLKPGYSITQVTDVTTDKELAKGDIWIVSGESVRFYAYYAITTKKVMNYGDEILFTVEEDQTTAIGSIEADASNEPAEIFDLSGRRVKADSLTPGIYVVRRGGESKKMLVK